MPRSHRIGLLCLLVAVCLRTSASLDAPPPGVDLPLQPREDLP